MILNRQSEKRPPEGGINGSGARRMLGRPEMAPLTLTVREAVQNSWDQRLRNGHPVTISFDWKSCAADEDQHFRESIFQDWPRSGLPEMPSGFLSLLIISDRNTKGLNGPLFSDEYEVGETDFNFIGFFRNVGRDRAQSIGGGTYGYGKATLYDLSRIFAIVAYSRYLGKDGLYKSRLMAAALGDEFIRTTGGRAECFTGRHWWGVLDANGKALPLEGEDADNIAVALGLPGFDPGETGTTVAIVHPSSGDEGIEDPMLSVGERIASTALSYAWPHLREELGTGQPLLKIKVSCDGRPVSVGPLATDSERAKAFSRSLDCLLHLKEADSITEIIPIKCLSPSKILGHLAVTKCLPQLTIAGNPRTREAVHLPFPDDCHHVALLRDPMLTVTYRQGPAPALAGLGYAAVFLAAKDLDHEFADAEPAAHDSWSWSDMSIGRGRTFVKTALKRIDEALRASFQADTTISGQTPGQGGLGGFMAFMAGLAPDAPGAGGLLPAGLGSGAAMPNGSKGTGGGGHGGGGRVGPCTGPWIDQVVNSRVDFHEGRRVCVVGFEVHDIASGTSISAHGNVLVDEGDHSESRAESTDLEVPTQLGWRQLGAPIASPLNTSQYLTLEPDDPGKWEVLLTMPDDVLVDVELNLVSAVMERTQ